MENSLKSQFSNVSFENFNNQIAEYLSSVMNRPSTYTSAIARAYRNVVNSAFQTGIDFRSAACCILDLWKCHRVLKTQGNNPFRTDLVKLDEPVFGGQYAVISYRNGQEVRRTDGLCLDAAIEVYNEGYGQKQYEEDAERAFFKSHPELNP